MKLTTAERDGAIVLTLAGKLPYETFDSKKIRTFESTVQRAFESESTRFVLDLRDVRLCYRDSAGMLLDHVSKTVRGRGISVVLVANETPSSVLSLRPRLSASHIRNWYPSVIGVFATVEDAINSFNSSATTAP